MKKTALGIVLLCALAQRAGAFFDSGGAGTSSAEFLKLGADSRAAAMGNAMTAVADDSTAIYWNPAGLAGLKQRHASLTHSAIFQSVFCDFLSYAQPMGSLIGPERRELRPSGLGTVALSLLYLNFGELRERDNTGQETNGSFTPQDFAATLAWGASVTHSLDLGVGFKYIDARIQKTARTWAMDGGAKFRTFIGGWPFALGAGAQNLGPGLRYHFATDPLPLTLRAGASLQPLPGWTLSSDIIAPRDEAPYPAAGSELRLSLDRDISLAVRGGWSSRINSSALNGASQISFGMGLAYRGLAMDYAWAAYGALGDIHRFSLSCRF